MLTVTLLLLLAAFIVTIAGAFKPDRLWVAVLLLVILELLRVLPR
jgi:hypothetical protein